MIPFPIRGELTEQPPLHSKLHGGRWCSQAPPHCTLFAGCRRWAGCVYLAYLSVFLLVIWYFADQIQESRLLLYSTTRVFELLWFMCLADFNSFFWYCLWCCCQWTIRENLDQPWTKHFWVFFIRPKITKCEYDCSYK